MKKACQFDDDQPPPALGPGVIRDAPYKFCFNSDYDQIGHRYRAQIVNFSPVNVRFSWDETGLSGEAGSAAPLYKEIPLDPAPMESRSTLAYDFRDVSLTAYRAQSQSEAGQLVTELWSTFKGFVLAKLKLVPVTVRADAAHDGQTFSYRIENQSGVPVRIQWLEFAEYWKKTQPEQYQSNFSRLLREKTIEGQSSSPGFILPPKMLASWSFQAKGAPVRRQSHFEIGGTDDARPTYSATAPLYLPQTAK